MQDAGATQFQGMDSRLSARLVDILYTEAMLLADEARAYFDHSGAGERAALSPLLRVGLSCESLKVTTRLMHVIAWLLTRRAADAGDISADLARAPSRRLAGAIESDPETVAALPPTAQHLIAESRDLYARVARLDDGLDQPVVTASPARSLLRRLERAF